MTSSIYSPDEQALLEAWFRSAPIDDLVLGLLEAAGFDHDCGPYTRLDAWVGAFAVAEIQERLPNCGICGPAGVTLTRKHRDTPDRTVTGLTRHLFTINWADSGPGISWPVAYMLAWIPVFDEFIVVASADGTDAFGYADFALGRFPAGGDWIAQVKEIVVADWRAQLDGWNQAPWAYLLSGGVVSEEAHAWRAEAWAGSEFDDWSNKEEAEENEESEEPPELPASSHAAPVTHLRIRLRRWKEFPPTPEHDYRAEVIKEGDTLYYRARGATIPITDYEFQQVVANPFLYYFSTALKLHVRIDHAIASQTPKEVDIH